jgi:uncharacterized surface protein with fasciclin (FAS1) repeats
MHIRRYVIPGIILCLVIIVGVYFFATRSKITPTNGDSIELSVTPSANAATALIAVQNAAAGDTSYSSSYSGSYTRPVPVPQDVLTAIRALPNTSMFVSLVERTGVLAELSASGTYTFFVPTNAAFSVSPLGPVSALSTLEQKRLAEYHIVSGQKMSVDAVKFGHMVMLSTDELNANVLETTSVDGNSHILGIYPTPNGIVYLIDEVLQPPVRRPFPL